MVYLKLKLTKTAVKFVGEQKKVPKCKYFLQQKFVSEDSELFFIFDPTGP